MHVCIVTDHWDAVFLSTNLSSQTHTCITVATNLFCVDCVLISIMLHSVGILMPIYMLELINMHDMNSKPMMGKYISEWCCYITLVKNYL